MRAGLVKCKSWKTNNMRGAGSLMRHKRTAMPPYLAIRLVNDGVIFLANGLGALLLMGYFSAISPVPTGDAAINHVSHELQIPQMIGTLILLIVGTFLLRHSQRFFPTWYEKLRAGTPHTEVPVYVRREVLMYPLSVALVSLSMWALAGIFFGWLPSREFVGFLEIFLAGGVMTSAIVFFTIEYSWRRVVRFFFPDGHLRQIGALRLPVFGRLLIVLLLTSLYPTALLAIVSLNRSHALVGAPNPQAILDNLLIAQIFLLTVGCLSGIGMAYFVSRTVVAPLGELENAMEKLEQNDLTVSVRVSSNDEIGYVSEQFNDMVAGLRRGELLRNLLNQYVSPEVAQEALEHGAVLGGQVIECTVLFSDIRGFTSLSEKLPADQLIDLLNRYMSHMVEAIVANGGMVNKFGGNSLLAVFGTPLNPSTDHAARAVRAAEAMCAALERFNLQQRFAALAELRFGIGIATGKAVAGNIGGAERIEYTVIGDTVNLASRLQDLTKELGQQVLIHATTYTLASKTHPFNARHLPPVTVRGKSELVDVYAMEW